MSTPSNEQLSLPQETVPVPDSQIVEITIEPLSEIPEGIASPEPILAEALPDESPFVDFQKLSPRAIAAAHIAVKILIGVIFLIGLVAFSVLAIALWPSWILGLSFIAFLVVLTILYVILHRLPIRAHRHASWRWNSQGLDIRRGIWFRQEISVPRGRVQHTDVHQGPLMRKFHVAKLMVHTAGTREYVVELDGLDYDVACQLRDLLISDQVARDGVN